MLARPGRRGGHERGADAGAPVCAVDDQRLDVRAAARHHRRVGGRVVERAPAPRRRSARPAPRAHRRTTSPWATSVVAYGSPRCLARRRRAPFPGAGSSRAPAPRADRRSAATEPCSAAERPRRAPPGSAGLLVDAARAGSAPSSRRRPAPRSRSRCAAPAPARSRRSASAICVERTIDFTTGICRGAIDRWRRPSPISIHASSGSPAMSPHIATGLPARSAPSTICLQRPQDRRVQRVVEVADVLVLAVGGQRVLDEVVGADAEEVALGGQQVGDQRRAGRLDHDAERHLAGRGRCPRAPARRRPRRTRCLAARSSATPEISGNRICIGPSADAR